MGTLALALLTLAALVLADQHQRHKREESELMSPMPFLMGSRYGRSAPRTVSARADRFFMSSRYGKRSERVPAEPGGAGPMGAAAVQAAAPDTAARALLCEYTGVFPLYRCVRRHRRLPHHKRSSEDNSAGDKDI